MYIGKVIKKKEGKFEKFIREISISNEKKELWVCVEEKYKDYYCEDRVDGYVLALLLRAMHEGEDIFADDGISETLLFQIEKYLIPYLCKLNPSLNKINIFCKTLPDIDEKAGVAATGISCGVDSLSTILYHTNQEICNSRNISCLTLFNSGYYGEGNESSDSFKKHTEQSKMFCEEHGFDFLTCDSNVYDFACFPFLMVHTYMACSIVLMLQKGISFYYYSSAGYPIDYKVSFSDSGLYDIFLFQCISTKSLQFISSCASMVRTEKLGLILQNPSYAKYLYVCVTGKKSKNCSLCEKCMRTLLGADSMGKVEMLSDSFELEIFYKKRNLFMGYMRRKNGYYKDIYESYRLNHRKIPMLAYIARFVPIKHDFLKIRSWLVKHLPKNFVAKLKTIRDSKTQR